jgi:polyisoprenoid-binding protein YceI
MTTTPTTTTTNQALSGYRAGTWQIDPVHSDMSFVVRHMMVSKVRGHFGTFTGTIVTAENPLESRATATIDMTSISTNNEQRDGHLRSPDFFETDSYKEMTFVSTGVRPQDDGFLLDGELSLKGVTKPITLTVEYNGIGPDAYGGVRAGFSATGEINRSDFNVSFNATYEGGGLVVSDKVQLRLEIEAVLEQPAAG